MAQPTAFDFQKGVDFTGAPTATAGDHNNLVDLAIPYQDSGTEAHSINLWTKDLSTGTPTVPDPSVFGLDRWKNYLWIRVPATSDPLKIPFLYTWNEDLVTPDPNLLKWQRVTADDTAVLTVIAALDVRVTVLESGLVAVNGIASAANSAAAAAQIAATNALTTATASSTTATAAQTSATAAAAAATAADTKADTAITNSAAAQTVAGTANTLASNANTLAQAATSVVSADYALAFGVVIATIVHGLGVTPKRVRWVLACLTLDPATGHAVGDEIPVEHLIVQVPPTELPAFWSYSNATTIVMRSSNSAFQTLSTAGVLTAITIANWKARCYYSIS